MSINIIILFSFCIIVFFAAKKNVKVVAELSVPLCTQLIFTAVEKLLHRVPYSLKCE